MATIDTSYFSEPIAIPQIENEAVAAAVNKLLDHADVELLERLLGTPLYILYTAGIVASTQIYKDIRDGKAYLTFKWWGLKFTQGTVKKSLIANYVYFHYVRNSHTVLTGTGAKTLKTENAVESSPWFKLVKAWNEMVDMNLDLNHFLLNNADLYPQYVDPFTETSYFGSSLRKERKDILQRRALFTKINPYF